MHIEPNNCRFTLFYASNQQIYIGVRNKVMTIWFLSLREKHNSFEKLRSKNAFLHVPNALQSTLKSLKFIGVKGGKNERGESTNGCIYNNKTLKILCKVL